MSNYQGDQTKVYIMGTDVPNNPGLPTSLGQKTAAGSTSVVQVGGATLAITAVPAVLANATTTFQVLAANTSRISALLVNNDPAVSYFVGVTTPFITDETSIEIPPGRTLPTNYQGTLYARTSAVPTKKLTAVEES